MEKANNQIKNFLNNLNRKKMPPKNFWSRLLKSISLKYGVLENFLGVGKNILYFEFSNSALKIIKILFQNQIIHERTDNLFLVSHLVVLKSGSGLVILQGFIFKVQKLKLKLKQNLNGVFKKYSTDINTTVLNNYFKVFFLPLDIF